MPAPRKQLPVGMEEKLRELAIAGYGVSQIWREIGQVVDRKTIERRVKEYAPPDPSGPWGLADSEPEDVRLTLEVALAVTEKSAGRAWPTRGAVDWALRVAAAGGPKLTPWDVYAIARDYQAHTERRESTRDLDLLLAARPWESAEAFERYRGLMRTGATDRLLFVWSGYPDVPAPARADELSSTEGRHHG